MDHQQQQTKKTRTITLTDRRPVMIDEAVWPRIARGTGDSWDTSGDGARYSQALHRGELDQYHLVVRQHADGRALVYAVLDAASAWTGSTDYRGGEMLDAGADIGRAVRRVGEAAGLPAEVIRDCIADLPAEQI